MIERGQIRWADLGPAVGSRPAKRRSVVVVQADSYNASALHTVLVAVVISNTALAPMPGNVFVPAAVSGLPRDSVVDVTALATLDRNDLAESTGALTENLMDEIDRGLRQVLAL